MTWVTATLILLVVGGGYLAWTWVPVYLVHYEVKQVVRDYMNQAVRNPEDALLVENMIHKLRVLDSQSVPGANGQLVTVPTVQVGRRDVTWERDTRHTPPTLHVAFEYTRAVAYPLIERWTERTMSVDLTSDISLPDWGPAR